MVTSQMKNVNNILGIIRQTSKKSLQHGMTLLMAFCDIPDNREITLEIMKTESLHCRGINLHLLFSMPIFKYLFLFYFFQLCWAFVAMYVQALSSCGEWRAQYLCLWVQLPCSIWDPPRAEIEPDSPALLGTFSTTGLPGKP